MMNTGALEGVKVLDLSRVLAGPFCTMMLGDMGAEVIKLEVPEGGDDSRAFPPFIDGESVYFKNLNRNKRGITLNLKGAGREVFLELVRRVDILVENYRPGTMEKLGLGWEELEKVNPRLIYGCVSGFGHSGPYARRAGYDIVGQGMSGLMSVTGWPGGGPTRCGAPVSDVVAGISLCAGLLAALHHRDRTGEGQKVDIALVDTLVAALQIINQIYLAEGRLPERIGNRYESSYPYDTFPTRDGREVVIGCANDKFWQALCGLMRRPDLAENPELATNRQRVEKHKLVRREVESWTREQEAGALVEQLLALGIPSCPIYDIEQVTRDPHIAGSREMFVEREYPRLGKLKVTNTHIKMSRTPPGFRCPSPDLGQHNEEIYGRLLGYSPEKLRELKGAGVI
jgi:formyl-CoA transferase